MNFHLAKEKQLPEGTEAPDRPEPGHSGSAEARTDGSMFPQVGAVPHPVLSGRGPHLRHRPGGAAHRLGGYAGGCTL